MKAVFPSIVVDLWFEVAEEDLYLVLPILPSSEWEGREVGVRIEFVVANAAETLTRFRTAQRHAVQLEAPGAMLAVTHLGQAR